MPYFSSKSKAASVAVVGVHTLLLHSFIYVSIDQHAATFCHQRATCFCSESYVQAPCREDLKASVLEMRQSLKCSREASATPM